MSAKKTEPLEDDDDFGKEEMQDENNNLSFEDLLPKSDVTFTLSDGSVIPFKVRETMNRDDFAKVTQLEGKMQRYLEQVKKDSKDEAAKKNLERCTDSFIRVILPEMPDDVLSGLVLGQKTKIIEFWGKRTYQGEDKAKN